MNIAFCSHRAVKNLIVMAAMHLGLQQRSCLVVSVWRFSSARWSDVWRNATPWLKHYRSTCSSRK